MNYASTKVILTDLGFTLTGPIKLYCDNQTVINITFF